MKHIKELQQLLSKYFNLSNDNLECLSCFVIGMFMVQTVNLAKLSKTFSTATKFESNYKRLQRFIRRLKFDDKALFLMIQKVFNLTAPLTLCMDRTNWKWLYLNVMW
jgi:predicted transcriptional regulator